MDQGGNPGLEAQLAAVLDWWRDAGVDAVFHDAPANWIAPAADISADQRPRAGGDLGQTEGTSAGARDPRLRGDAAPVADAPPLRIPATLADFTAWWMSEPALDGGRTTGRVPPRGAAGAQLMVLVPEPEREDSDVLLSGPQGRLLAAMLQAMGIAPEEVYVASMLPRHTPHADWEGLSRAGLGQAAARHVALVRPQQLLTFGQNIPSLLSNDPPNNSANSSVFNHEGVNVPSLSDRSLGALLERPRWKAGFWQRWIGRNSAG